MIWHTSETVSTDCLCLSQKIRRNCFEYFRYPEKYSLVINVRGGKFVYLRIHTRIKASHGTPLLCTLLYIIVRKFNTEIEMV